MEVPEDRILTFREGIPGFSKIHRFAVLEMEALKPFRYLQSLDEPPISLFIINPFLVDPNYEFSLTDSDMEDVKSTDSAQLEFYVVATIPDDPRNTTLNLMAPIVINDKDRCGKQIIMHDSGYSVKHPLLHNEDPEEVKKQNAGLL